MAEQKSYFDTLNGVDCSGKVEQKNGLTYLSWAWAWAELKKRYPFSYYTIYEDNRGINYFTDGKTCYVKTGVTVVVGEKEIEHIEYLPVMDFRNKSIPVDAVTSFDVNKAIQRSLTKAVARHGLGLYIYSGEDLPEEVAEQKEAEKKAAEEIKKKPISKAKQEALVKLAEAVGSELPKILQACRIDSISKMTEEQFVYVKSKLESRPRINEGKAN